MEILKNNLTFAIVQSPKTWRLDITERCAEYHSHLINGHTFLDKIIKCSSFDEAILKSTTDYVIIQTVGNIIHDVKFYELVANELEEGLHIFLGFVRLFDDYALLDKKCLIVNKKAWEFAGRPSFNGTSRDGPKFKCELNSKEPSLPFLIEKIPDDRTFVAMSCTERGASLIAKQLDLYGKITPLQAVAPSQSHYIDNSTPYHEIHTETFFEKKILPSKKKIVTIDTTEFISDRSISPTIIVSAARGLRALSLCDAFKPSKIIVYDTDDKALEFQRRLLTSKTAVTYNQVIDEFKRDFPDSPIEDLEGDIGHTVVPQQTVEVICVNVDITTCEAEDLLKGIDDKPTALFDFADSFIYPLNFYKKPLYQMQGLFSEIFSLIKSRRGPSFIFGFAPGFEQTDRLNINTAKSHTREFEGENLENVRILEFIPSSSEPIQAQIIPEDKCLQDAIDSTTLEISKDEETQEMATVHIDTNSPTNVAANLGYEVSRVSTTYNGEPYQMLMFSKNQEFDSFTAVFEYTFNQDANTWSFKSGKLGSDKRVEFSNGTGEESLIRHLGLAVKFNPRTAIKYF